MKPISFAYLRVSTSEQDVNHQRHGILEYANRKGFGEIQFIDDACSGTIHWRKRKLGELLNSIAPQSTLLFAETSRIGRNTLQILEFLQEAAEKEIAVHLAKENLLLDSGLHSTIIVTVLGLVADIERSLISTRTKEALALKKSEGIRLGRPPGKSSSLMLDDKEEEILGYLSKGLSLSTIAKLVDCHRNTLSNWLKVRGHSQKHRASPDNYFIKPTACA